MGNAGRKKEHTLEELSTLIEAVPFKKRGTLRDLSEAMNIPTTALSWNSEEGLFKKFNCCVKPEFLP